MTLADKIIAHAITRGWAIYETRPSGPVLHAMKDNNSIWLVLDDSVSTDALRQSTRERVERVYTIEEAMTALL